MLRRVVYAAASVLVGVVLLPAVVIREVRLGFITLAAAIGVGAWWVARRLPARPISSRELRIAAVLVLVAGLVIAFLIPSTRMICDCPPVPGGGGCNCGIEHHYVLRLWITVGGAVLSAALVVAARIRTMTVSPAT